MRGIVLTLLFLVTSAGSFGQTPKGSKPTATSPLSPQLRPSSEMERLLQAFVGSWNIRESFEISASKRGAAREGTAVFREGPGFSLMEDYRSNGSAGELRFLGILWWDPHAQLYRLFTCANNDGCQVRGTLRWDGQTLANTWEEKIQGKKVAFKDSFREILPASFTLVSEGVAEGKTIWHVTTRYTRQIPGKE